MLVEIHQGMQTEGDGVKDRVKRKRNLAKTIIASWNENVGGLISKRHRIDIFFVSSYLKR